MIVLKLAVFGALVAVATSAAIEVNPADTVDPSDLTRLTGGSPAPPGRFPYHASLFYFDRFHRLYSGAALIAPSHLVSLASNLREIPTIVVLGTELARGPRRNLQSAVVHPQYRKDQNHAFDIAVLKVDKPFEITPAFAPVTIAQTGAEVSFNGQVVYITGFGRAGTFYSHS